MATKSQNVHHLGSGSRQQLGEFGERLVADYLLQQGFTIRNHNYRQRTGEIDLIAQKKDLLIFVEVKLRRARYFTLSDVVNGAKQKKIMATAQRYIMLTKSFGCTIRFDVACIEPDEQGQLTINYKENAFTNESGSYVW